MSLTCCSNHHLGWNVCPSVSFTPLVTVSSCGDMAHLIFNGECSSSRETLHLKLVFIEKLIILDWGRLSLIQMALSWIIVVNTNNLLMAHLVCALEQPMLAKLLCMYWLIELTWLGRAEGHGRSPISNILKSHISHNAQKEGCPSGVSCWVLHYKRSVWN